MRGHRPRHRVPLVLSSIGAIIGLVATLGTHAAMAQDSRDTQRRYTALVESCRSETTRLCPELADSSPQPRNIAICLRPFRTSLSLSCRRAVNAVLTPPVPAATDDGGAGGVIPGDAITDDAAPDPAAAGAN